MEFHSKQKWACNSISRHTNESLLCHMYFLFTVSYCPYCSTYYVHVLRLENMEKKTGAIGDYLVNPLSPRANWLMPRPRNDPGLESKPLPVPLPFCRGHFGGYPFHPRSLHWYLAPEMTPESSQKLPPSPSPSPGAGTGKGAPPFNVPFRPL